MTLFAEAPGVAWAILVAWFLLVVGVMIAVTLFSALVIYHVRKRHSCSRCRPLVCDGCGDRIEIARAVRITDGERSAIICKACAEDARIGL